MDDGVGDGLRHYLCLVVPPFQGGGEGYSGPGAMPQAKLCHSFGVTAMIEFPTCLSMRSENRWEPIDL
jgi:hypothetical protein